MTEQLTNNQKWGIWAALIINLIFTVTYVTAISESGHVLFFASVISLWLVIIVAIKFKLSVY